ncbi:MAG: hypothetical protein ACOYUK_04040 [Patescibacteria group bacterium]
MLVSKSTHGCIKEVSTVAQQQHAKRSRWSRFVHTLYRYRGWWVDSPTISLLGLFHWHFYSNGLHAVPDEMPEFCWAVLVMYLAIKEKVRWERLEMLSRRGSILVALWLFSAIEFFVVMAWDGHHFQMPPQMVATTLIVLGGFVGILPVKYHFTKRFPNASGAFQVGQNE